MSFSSKSQREEGKTEPLPTGPWFPEALPSWTGFPVSQALPLAVLFGRNRKQSWKLEGLKWHVYALWLSVSASSNVCLGWSWLSPPLSLPLHLSPTSSHPSCQLSVACLSPLKWQFLLEGSMASNLFAQYSPGSLSQRLSWALLSIWAQLVDLSECRVLAYQCIAYICHMRTSSPAWHKVHGGAGLSCGPWSGAAEGTPLSPVSVCKEDRHFWVFLGGPHTC